jgi:hypothetical protein
MTCSSASYQSELLDDPDFQQPGVYSLDDVYQRPNPPANIPLPVPLRYMKEDWSLNNVEDPDFHLDDVVIPHSFLQGNAT